MYIKTTSKISSEEKFPIDECIYNTKVSIEDLMNVEINDEISKIKEEYENKLQRQKVHIPRGDGTKGNRIHGRRCKIAISKRSFRNKKSIVGFPNGTQ